MHSSIVLALAKVQSIWEHGWLASNSHWLKAFHIAKSDWFIF